MSTTSKYLFGIILLKFLYIYGRIRLERRIVMKQNLKNFLIAFATGLVVFGACAVLVIAILQGGL